MKFRVIILVAALLFSVAVAGYAIWWLAGWEVVREVQHIENPGKDMVGADDKPLPAGTFRPNEVIDGLVKELAVNNSAATFRLDAAPMHTGADDKLMALRASYLDAIRAVPGPDDFLPSVCCFAGAARQFDDGAVATIELAAFNGQLGDVPSTPEVLEKIFERLGPDSSARPFIGAALELAGRAVDLRPTHEEERDRLLSSFEADTTRYKTVGFYAWGPQLERVRRFSRFLQYEFTAGELRVPRDIAEVLRNSPDLHRDYRRLNSLYAAVGNPHLALPVDALLGDEANLGVLARQFDVERPVIAVLPPTSNAFRMLYQNIVGGEVPPNVNIMAELTRRILRYTPDLEPVGQNRGWYQFKVNALEGRLLPIHGPERNKLALTARFKARLAEIEMTATNPYRTVRRRGETSGQESQPENLLPKLRLEPYPIYYLRTARGYAWLESYLGETIGQDQLRHLHGATPHGIRRLDLATELVEMRQRFYGFYLLSCEDLGIDPTTAMTEEIAVEACRDTAKRYLADIVNDPDLASDARVADPLYEQQRRRRVAFLGIFGVRLSRLRVSYDALPKVRALDDPDADWADPDPGLVGERIYIVPVDDYGEFELRDYDVLSRQEFRAICDDKKTHTEIKRAFMEREYME